MDGFVSASGSAPDWPMIETNSLWRRSDDNILDTTEQAVEKQRRIAVGGETIVYTARAGHLVICDKVSAQPTAKIFYVSFNRNDVPAAHRLVTFFYNGGPGSSSMFLLVGSFAPHRIKPSMLLLTPPAPYRLADNADSLIDQSGLVLINLVGTGYPAAFAPSKKRDFRGCRRG